MLEDLNKVVTAGVGPLIVISACGLLCSTFYNRITNVIVRLRAIQRERLAEESHLLRETDEPARLRRRELLGVLGTQTDSLVRRIRILRSVLFCLLSTISAMVFCSLLLGLSMINRDLVGWSVASFILGLALLILAMGFAMMDLMVAIQPVVMESEYVTRRVRGAADKA
jgi:Protein of unknown function (DUF2721)